MFVRSIRTLFPVPLAIALVLGCGRDRELREWTPEDHQPAPGGGVPEDVEGPTAGAALFNVHCATCHGPDGRGDGPGAPPMARVPDLTDPVLAARRSDADVEVLILAGRGFMPGFESTIPREGIRALALHVRTLAPPAAVAPTPTEGTPAEGAPTEAAPEATE